MSYADGKEYNGYWKDNVVSFKNTKKKIFKKDYLFILFLV